MASERLAVLGDQAVVRSPYSRPVRVGLCWGILVVGVLTAGCSDAGQSGVTYARFRFSCCTSADVSQVWRAGESVDLHWMVESATATTDAAPHPIVLTAILTGPYVDVLTLKKGGGAASAVQGPVIRTDDRTPTPPVTAFLLPKDLPHGYYDLRFKVDFGNGNSEGGDSVVQVES